MKVEIQLQQLLDNKNISQRELERRTGIFQATISKMCAGTLQHMPLDALARICETLDCSITDVLKLKSDDKELNK